MAYINRLNSVMQYLRSYKTIAWCNEKKKNTNTYMNFNKDIRINNLHYILHTSEAITTSNVLFSLTNCSDSEKQTEKKDQIHNFAKQDKNVRSHQSWKWGYKPKRYEQSWTLPTSRKMIVETRCCQLWHYRKCW